MSVGEVKYFVKEQYFVEGEGVPSETKMVSYVNAKAFHYRELRGSTKMSRD